MTILSDWVRVIVVALASVLAASGLGAAEEWHPTVAPQTPTIPERTFSITNYGAVGDGVTMNTASIQKAIDACAKAGGGHVVVPNGGFLTGPIQLRDSMDLHLAMGAALQMSQRVEDYPTNGRELKGFITATDSHDISISGEGTIDGQGEPWWINFRRIKDTPAAKSEPRRPQMVALSNCDRVVLAGIKTLNPPNTHCSLRQCREVTIDGLTMTAPADSPNTDALNLNIRNAVIRGCHIATGDDNIVFLGSAAGKDGEPGVENILVSDCTLGVGHGLSFGSYTSGGIRNVAVQNIAFSGTTAGIRMKAARDRGGLVERLTFKNITMRGVRNPIYLTSYYPKEPKYPNDDQGEPVSAKTPRWRDIVIDGTEISDCSNSIIIWGLPEQPIAAVTLRNLKVSATRGAVIYNAKGVRFEKAEIRPETGPVLTTFNAEVEGMPSTPVSETRK